MRIINIEPQDYSDIAKKILGSIGTLEEGPMEREKLLHEIGKYEIAITRLAHKFDAEMFRAAKNLKIVVTATTGLNHIDMDYAKAHGIQVLSLRGETEFLDSITSTSELAWGLLLQLLRPIAQAHEDVLKGRWRRDDFRGNEISGKTIGILGCGRLGKKTAAHAKAFDAKVLVYDVREIEGHAQADLNTVLQNADILFVHLPSNETTKHFLDGPQISLIKRGAYIINTARGEIVNEAALLQALQQGHIAGAALDVLQGENTGSDAWLQSDPLINYARQNGNLILTPHIGGAAFEAMEKTEIFMAKKLKDYLMTAGHHA